MDIFRSLFLSRKTKQHDPENGQEQVNVVANLAADLDLDPDTARRSATYRLAVGIASTPSMTPKGGTSLQGRVAANLGLYPRVVRYERAARLHYHTASKVITIALGVQIVVAAALTALGAADRGHASFKALGTVITVLGAINTIIAGFLTYLKGSSLPNRYKYYEHEWRRVRELIEQRERDFLNPECTLDVFETVNQIERTYMEVKADIENSAPDNFISPSKVRRQDKQKEAVADAAPIKPLVDAAKTATQHTPEKTETTLQALAKGAEEKLNQVVNDLQEKGNERVAGSTDRLRAE